jgi:hypothetical protein
MEYIMPSIAREIVDAILDKNNVNANEKIYDSLYGKSSEQLLARKAVIAKHFFSPESDGNETDNNAEIEDTEETAE